jgi:hypothetical protein
MDMPIPSSELEKIAKALKEYNYFESSLLLLAPLVVYILLERR